MSDVDQYELYCAAKRDIDEEPLPRGEWKELRESIDEYEISEDNK